MQESSQVLMQLSPEVHRLQQEVELLRLKDLQQEHHIHILTQQLRSSQPQTRQVETQSQAEPLALPSSVTAKWQEWCQTRSLSPERFHPPKFQRVKAVPGEVFRASSPPSRQHRSISKGLPRSMPSRQAQQPASSQLSANSHLVGDAHSGRHSGSRRVRREAKPHQSHYQISAAVGASGRVGRSKGTFGSEHRWYQPTQATDKAAALTHQALAAAAAEHELEAADWLLKSSPGGRSKSAQRCTFGSELRWWESVEPGRNPHTAEGEALHQHQAMLSSPGLTHTDGPIQKPGAPPVMQAGSTDHSGVTQTGSTYDVQWQENAAAGQAVKQEASAAAAASAPQSGSAHGAAGSPHSRQRSISADRGLRQTQPLMIAEQAWWKSDRDPSPDSTLQRIQRKHARIQSLAAIIKQRPNSARTHTVKSTFGSDTRWWEKSSAYDDASASGRSADHQQRDESSRASSPDSPRKLQHMSCDTSTHDIRGAFRGRSTFGSEARWWEPKKQAVPTAVAVQYTAVAAQTSAMRPLLVVSADRSPVRARHVAADSWWGHNQQHHTPQSPDGAPPESLLLELQSLSPAQQNRQPATLSASAQQHSIQRLHAQPWTAGLPLPIQAGSRPESMGQSGVSTTPHRTPVRASTSSLTPMATPQRQSRGSITPVATPARQSRGSITPVASPARQSRGSITPMVTPARLSRGSISPGSLSRHSSIRQSRDSVSRASSVSECSRSGSPDVWVKGGRQLNRIASSRPELQDELRHRSAERQQLEQVVAPHPSNWAQGLRDDTRTFQRRDSRVEARALQQDFLQKAKQDLETFQRNCSFAAAAHGLSSSAGLDACSSQDAPAVDGQLDEQPPSRHADSDSTVAGGAAYRCARQWLRAAKQGQYGQAPGQGRVRQAPAPATRLSHQGSASKAAMQLVQQQLAAQEAEQRLMAFCQATDESHAESSTRQIQETVSTSKPASAASVISGTARQVQQPRAVQQQAAFTSSPTAPKKLMTHSSLPSTYAAPSAIQGAAGAKIVRSVSWAQQLELQQIPHDDSYDSPHMDHGRPPAMPVRAAGDTSTAKSARGVHGADRALPAGSAQSRREALDAYYRVKQAAAPVPPQRAATFAAAASLADVASQESSSAPLTIAPLNTHGASPSGLASQSSSASVVFHAAEDIAGPPARRASLLLAQARSQLKADALNPGKPGLKSQLSQMMEEVAQARCEVQEVQSQLSVHSRLGLRSGSTASSLLSDSVVDAM